MKKVFNHIPCGETIPINNVHAVSVSMPTLQDVIDYEEQTTEILKKIKSGYPRFVLHPYLRILANYIKKKYKICDDFEVVLLSSQKSVEVVSLKYSIINKIDVDENFGVILVLNGTPQLEQVLKFIQHVGCNLSSRFAQEYLYVNKLIDKKQDEILHEEEGAKDVILNTLSQAYNQSKENIFLTPSGMNSIYSVISGLKDLHKKDDRDILIQFGWLYLDTMNIVKHYYKKNEIFYDITDLEILEKYLEKMGNRVSALITEVPTNPLILTVDLKKLKILCDKYSIPIIIDTTFATPFNLDLDSYGDIFVESLTKFASGNADVLMGAIVVNKNSKYVNFKEELFIHADEAYIKDLQRLAIEIVDYKTRVEKISQNTIKLIEHLKKAPYIDKIYHCMQELTKDNYKNIMKNDSAYSGIISVTFKKSFRKCYDKLNFAKGPSLGCEFTLLMPYTYLAHYDLVITEDGNRFLEKIGLPIDLLRISVGMEDIDDIKNEFDRLILE